MGDTEADMTAAVAESIALAISHQNVPTLSGGVGTSVAFATHQLVPNLFGSLSASEISTVSHQVASSLSGNIEEAETFLATDYCNTLIGDISTTFVAKISHQKTKPMSGGVSIVLGELPEPNEIIYTYEVLEKTFDTAVHEAVAYPIISLSVNPNLGVVDASGGAPTKTACSNTLLKYSKQNPAVAQWAVDEKDFV